MVSGPLKRNTIVAVSIILILIADYTVFYRACLRIQQPYSISEVMIQFHRDYQGIRSIKLTNEPDQKEFAVWLILAVCAHNFWGNGPYSGQ